LIRLAYQTAGHNKEKLFTTESEFIIKLNLIEVYTLYTAH